MDNRDKKEVNYQKELLVTLVNTNVLLASLLAFEASKSTNNEAIQRTLVLTGNVFEGSESLLKQPTGS